MKSKKILCIGAHPDDLEVGMGGTIAKLVSQDHDVTMLVILVDEYHLMDVREIEARESAMILGANIEFMKIKLDEMVYSRKLIQKFDEYIYTIDPEIVFTHWLNDSHQDHQIVAKTTISALRKNKCSLYMYEECIPGGITPFSFKTQLYIKIDEFIDQKINALKKHKTQLKNLHHENLWIYGVKGRAQYRGYQINSKFAEAFEVIKEIREF